MIIFVDDDRRYITEYIKELTDSNYLVSHQYNMNTALNYVIEKYRKREIELLVLDIMMPPGELFRDRDTDNGRRTGLVFIKALEERIDKIDFPLIIFTHVNIDNLDNKYPRFQKEYYTPSEFAEEINQIINPVM